MLSILSGPLCSIVLCILAGIALRYALWYGKDDKLAQDRAEETDELRRQRSELVEQLQTERTTSETLRGDYQQLCEEFDRYRQAEATPGGETRTATITKLEETIAELQQELSSGRETTAQLRSDLAHEIASNRTLNDQLRGASNATNSFAGKQNKLVAKLSQMATERDAANAELATLRDERDEIAARRDNAESQLAEKEQQIAELRSSLSETNTRLRQTHDADSQLAERTSQLERAGDELAALQARCDELETAVETTEEEKSQLNDRLATLTADARFADDLRKQLSGMQAAFQRRSRDVQQLTDQRDTLGEQLNTANRRLDEAERQLSDDHGESARLHQLLAAKAAEIEQVTNERTMLATELAALRETTQAAIAASDSQLQEARTGRMELRSELESRQTELNQLAAENAALVKELTELRKRTSEELAVAYEKLQAVEDKSLRRIDAAERRIDAADAKCKAELAEQQAELQSAIEHTSAELERQRRTLAAERQQLADDAARELADRQQSFDEELARHAERIRSETDGRLHELEGQLQQLRDQLRDVQTEKEEVLHGLHREQDRHTAAEARLAEALRQQATYRSDSESLRARINQSDRRLQMLEDELQQSEQRVIAGDTKLQDLRVQNTDLAAELERERQERAALERALDVHTTALDKLRADSQALESLLERQAAVQSSLQQHTRLLKSGRDPQPVRETPELPTEKPEVPAEPESSGVYSFATPTEQIPGSTRFDPILGPVFSTAPMDHDDLQMISGIDRLLEEKLNRLGVYTFDQIMQWDSRAVLEFSNILAIQGRVQRERWVEQARELYHLNLARRAA